MAGVFLSFLLKQVELESSTQKLCTLPSHDFRDQWKKTVNCRAETENKFYQLYAIQLSIYTNTSHWYRALQSPSALSLSRGCFMWHSKEKAWMWENIVF